MIRNREKAVVFIVLQFMNILFSLNSVLIKMVSMNWEQQGLFAVKTIMCLAVAILILGGYAILWQKMLAKVELTVAYMCKGMLVFWGMLWAFIIFGEKINIYNIIGSVIIFIGTFLVTSNE